MPEKFSFCRADPLRCTKNKLDENKENKIYLNGGRREQKSDHQRLYPLQQHQRQHSTTQHRGVNRPRRRGGKQEEGKSC